MPMIILIILIFFNLVALAFDQGCICNDFGTSTNQFCWDQRFVGFFLRVHQGFCPFTLCKKVALICGITHFNTMILIPFSENCKLQTYWYHLIWVWVFSPQYPYYHGLWISKKVKYPYQMGMFKIQYRSTTGPNLQTNRV
jgi:hypothetical protein